MTRPLQDFAELCELLDSLCEESFTPEQIRRLEELILAHPQAEAYYVQYMNFHANLAYHFRALPGRTEPDLCPLPGSCPADESALSIQPTSQTPDRMPPPIPPTTGLL